MGKSSTGKASQPRSMTRAEKSEVTQRALLDAAVKVIGSEGYADASIAKITQQAEVAQGTFYNYFGSQQELFDQLLPLIGQRLIERIRESRRQREEPLDRELAGFETFFDFLLDVPEFYRLLTEAETFAPEAHRSHVENMVSGYVRTLRRLHSEGWFKNYEEHEFEAVAYILIGIRHYLAMRYSYRPGSVHRLPGWVAGTYAKLLSDGLFGYVSGSSRRKGRSFKRPSMADLDWSSGKARVVQVANGTAIVECDIRPESSEPVHGAITNLAASAASAALGGNSVGGPMIGGIVLSIIEPPTYGRLVARAEVEGAASVVRISVHQDGSKDRHVALAQVSFSPAQPMNAQTPQKQARTKSK
jgi:AcrR family transcriptional regulator